MLNLDLLASICLDRLRDFGGAAWFFVGAAILLILARPIGALLACLIP